MGARGTSNTMSLTMFCRMAMLRRGSPSMGFSVLWFGTPCTSVSFARFPPLRSYKWEMHQAFQLLREKVELGNELMRWTAHMLTLCHSYGTYCCLENPLPGFMWLQPEIVAPMTLGGFGLVRAAFQTRGSPFVESTGLLSNLPVIHWLRSEPDFWLAA